MKILVLGASLHQGDYEGNRYDYLKVYMVAKQEQSEIRTGAAGIDMRGDSSLYPAISKINFQDPVLCEVETETRATGGGNMKEVIVNVTPVVKQVSK